MPVDPKQTHIALQWPHASPLITCRFDPRGRYVFGTAEDRTIQRWTLADGAKVGYPAQETWIRGMVFLPDGETMITGGYDGRLAWWPVAAEKPEPIRVIDAHRGQWIRSVSVSPDGAFVVSGGNDRLVKLWSAAEGTPVRTFEGHDSHVYSTLYHPGGQFVLSGDLSGKVHQWNVSDGKLVRTFDASALHSYNDGQQVHYGGVRSLALSPDGKLLAASGLDNASNPLGAVNDPLVLTFDWESAAKKLAHKAGDLKGVAWRVLFHPAGFLIAASGGSGGGFLLFWQADQEKELHRLQLPNTARDMDLHPDGIQVATAHHDRHLRISRMEGKPDGRSMAPDQN